MPDHDWMSELLWLHKKDLCTSEFANNGKKVHQVYVLYNLITWAWIDLNCTHFAATPRIVSKHYHNDLQLQYLTS